MEKRFITLWEKEEYTFPMQGEFRPFLAAYEVSGEEGRPAVLIIPGGGYMLVAAGEAEPVAKRFLEKGYRPFVLVYTTKGLQDIPLKNQPLKDAIRAMVYLRSHAEELHILSDHIFVCGFSAGGHLAASLAVHGMDEDLREVGKYAGVSSRPDAAILSYPVITATKECAHMGSIHFLTGPEPSKEELQYFSLEEHVTKDTPPAFIWQTVDDAEVPVDNAMLMAAAYKKAGVPFELHLFPTGAHGCSVADEAWAAGEYGDDYTMEQFFIQVQEYIDRGEPLPGMFGGMTMPKGTDYRAVFRNMPKDYLISAANPHVAVWPDLAEGWLKELEQLKIKGRTGGNGDK